MSPTRGRRIALLVGTMAVLALICGTVATWDRLREEWYLWRLSSEDIATRQRAVDALVSMKSVRGAKEMIRLVREDRFHAIDAKGSGGREAYYLVDPLGYGLFALGPIALALLHQESDEMVERRVIIQMIETARAWPVDVISLGAPDWPERLPPGMPPDIKKRMQER